jgi:hypothetical protein
LWLHKVTHAKIRSHSLGTRLSSRYMGNYSDILFPRHGSTHELSRIITGLRYCLFDNVCLMNRHQGEYRIQPVPVAVFDRWCQLHPQFPYAVQFSNQCLVISIMLPSHDRAAGIISNEIMRTVDRMCPLNDALFVSGTGCIHPRLEFLTSSDGLAQWGTQERRCSLVFSSSWTRNYIPRSSCRGRLLGLSTKV